uniref:O-antigen ligase domain-containing protein n=1 Tax=candidate division CPR3 bacterium TaxID=2268181 RepID=A0A7V3JAT1_UNCC3
MERHRALSINLKDALIAFGVSLLCGVLIVRYNLLIIPIIAGIILFLLSLCKYEFIFYLGISSFVFYNLAIIHFGSFDGKPYQIIWSMVFIAYTLKSLYHREQVLKFDKIDIPLFTLLAAYMLSLINSINSGITLKETIQLFYFILTFKIICASIKNKKEMIRVFHLVIIFGLIFIGIGLLTVFIGRAPFPQLVVDMSRKKISLNTHGILFQEAMRSVGRAIFTRVSSCFIDYVATANISCQILIILLVLIGGKHLGVQKKVLLSLAFLLGGILLIFTFSRAGMTTFILSAMLVMYFRKQFKSILIFLLVLISVIIFYQPLKVRMKEAGTLEQHSTRGHLALYWAACNIFLRSPLHGIGAGTFKELDKSPLAKDAKKKFNVWGWPDAHNMFLQCAAETGIIGLISLISIIGIYFHSLIKAIRIQEDSYYRDLLIGLTLANFCAVLMNLTMNAFGVDTFWVIAGVGYAAASLAHPSPNIK